MTKPSCMHLKTVMTNAAQQPPQSSPKLGRRTSIPNSAALKITRSITAAFFILAGLNHFVSPQWYLANQMPPWVPFPLLALYVTGAAEIAGGIGILLDKVRRMAGRGLVLLLIGIFPANIHMTLQTIQLTGWGTEALGLLLRLPFQAVFIVVVLWVSRPPPETSAP